MKALLIVWFVLLLFGGLHTLLRIRAGDYPRIRYEPLWYGVVVAALSLALAALVGVVLWA